MKRIKGNNQKIKFRRSSEWTNFRLELIKERGFTCECCGRKLLPRQLQVHHLNPEDYTNLSKENFAVLCHYCHENVERLSKMRQDTRDEMNQDFIKIYDKFITGKRNEENL